VVTAALLCLGLAGREELPAPVRSAPQNPSDKGGGGYPIGLTMAIMRQPGLKGGDE
jgi:hypothetical protein